MNGQDPSLEDETIVQTVLGPVPVVDLGNVQPHEHIFSDSTREAASESRGAMWRHYHEEIRLDNYYEVRRDHVNIQDQRLDSVEQAVDAVDEFRRYGGGTLVDVTPRGLRRNPAGLRTVAEITGVNIVMGCGYYVSGYHPADLAERSEGELLDELLIELQDGVDGSGICPGVIGEIGLSWPASPDEIKVLRAASQAQAISGLGLVIHPGRSPQAPFHHLRVVEESGGDVSRCVMSHTDRTLFTVDDIERLARTGCFVAFDLFGIETSYYSLAPIDLPNDAMRINYILQLAERALLSQVLISQDICNKTRLSAYGGEGYAHILKRVVPLMERKGLALADIERLLIENPARMLAQSR